MPLVFSQIFGDQGKFVQCGSKVFYDLGCDYVGGGEIGGVLEAIVFQPENVQAGFVAFDQIVVSEGVEALGFLALVAIFGMVAGDKIIQVLAAQWVCLQREVLICAEVVDPQLLCPGLFAGDAAVEKHHIGLDSLRVEDARWQAQQRVHIAIVQQPPANQLAGTALKEHVVLHLLRLKADGIDDDEVVLVAAIRGYVLQLSGRDDAGAAALHLLKHGAALDGTHEEDDFKRANVSAGTNLNRILYATKEDARLRRPKVEVMKRGIENLDLGCEVVPVMGSVLDSTVLKRLNEADFIFGCVDKDFPRMVLCQYAYQYLVPFIDVGAEIGGDDEGIVSTDARANYIAPGRWCLRCTGLINPRRLAFESLTGPERKRRIALGYSDDLMMKQPAVMDLNMRAASMGMMILRHLLQPFLLDPLPVTLAENLVTYNMKPLAVARAKNESCDICRCNPTAGFGDCAESIGLPSEVVTSLIEGDDDVDWRGTRAAR